MKKISNLTVCIIAHNEEQYIARAIKSVQNVAEIVVIDDYSSDKTVSISKKLGATVYKRHLAENFAAQRNFALKKAKQPWVMFIDGDEYATAKLMKEIGEVIEDTSVSGYVIRRKDEWMGKTMEESEWGNQLLLRLAQRKHGVWERSVHEKWNVHGKVKTLESPLMHTSHEDIAGFINQISFHARLHSKENIAKFKNVTLFIVVCYPIGKFIMNWVLKRGYKDGARGFLYAMFMSLHSFLAWSHLYIQQNEQN